MSPTMNQQEFNTLRAHIEQVFAQLYLIDVDTLTIEQRRQHQQSLSAAYLALVNAEHAAFNQLTDDVKTSLASLLALLQRLQQEVSGLPTPHEKLAVVAQGISIFARVAQLL